MGKAKSQGAKVDVKALFAPAPKPSAPKAAAWSQGAGAAACKPAGQAASVPKPSGPKLVGSWAKSGPQGLAATATSLSAKPAGYAPPPRAGPAPGAKASVSLGLKKFDKGPPPPSVLDNEAFPEAQKPKGAKEIAQDKAQAAAAASFPEVTTAKEASAALCKIAKAGGVDVVETGSTRLVFGAVLPWLLRSGFVGAPTEDARAKMMQAAVLMLNDVAKDSAGQAEVRSNLDSYFEEQQSKGKNTPEQLIVNGLVDAHLYGGLAVHLGGDQQKQGNIRMRLVRRLAKNTTPVSVQPALADALVPLLAADLEAAETIRAGFCKDLADSNENVRRGAALGIVAVVRASGGAGAVKKLGILDFVKEMLAKEGKPAAPQRQGALLCLGNLASSLGRAFEPYALSTMPLLLASCSDTSRDVQVAGRAAAQAVVSQVSSNGVRLMVNPLLEGLQDKRWKTQIAALELLKPMVGTLAEQAPKRLAALLPKVMPLVCDAASSTRSDVRDAAKGVLQQLGDSIDHPDVKTLAPTLIAALSDPSDGPVSKALDTLLKAVFTTAITASASSVLFPVVSRALSRGDPDSKKKAANFVRTLVRLAAELEDIEAYIIQLRPQLQALLADPHPEVREAVAGAIGALSAVAVAEQEEQAEVGEDGEAAPAPVSKAATAGDLTGSLLEKVNATKDSVEAEGAALGLATAMASLPNTRRQELLGELLLREPTSGRLGRLVVCAHLPKAMSTAQGGDSVLVATLPELEATLSDPVEKMRAAAMRALKATILVVRGEPLSGKLVESLCTALRADDSRARVAAAELALELVPKLKVGSEARSVLATAIILVQADDTGDVRRLADRVWRAAADAGGAPGKQLRDLRPRLVSRILSDLTGGQDSAASTAGRAAANLVERLDGSIIDEILMRIVEFLYTSEDAKAKQACCLGLAELLGRCQRAQQLLQDGELSEALKECLCDEDAKVRQAAATCAAAVPASNFVVPMLTTWCEDSAEEQDFPRLSSALESLCCAVAPRLPGSAANASASGASGARAILGAVIGSVAGKPCELHVLMLRALASAPLQHLKQVLPDAAGACIRVAASGFLEAADAASAIVEALKPDPGACDDFITAIADRVEAGVLSTENKAVAKVLGSALVATAVPPKDARSVLDRLLPGTLLDTVDSGQEGQEACAVAFAEAIQSLCKACGGVAKLVEGGLEGLSAALEASESERATLSDVCFEALIGLVATHGVSSGTADQRILAAECEAKLLRRAGDSVLQAHAVKCAGPLARVLGEKPPDASLQAAILQALDVLVSRGGSTLKPLAPVLQTSLVRVLESPFPEANTPEQRRKDAAIRVVAGLAPVAPRPEALVKNLCKAAGSGHVAGIEALGAVMKALGASAPADAVTEAKTVIKTAQTSKDAAVKSAADKCSALL
eukprot:TRINITY_DN90318_c0_g1_i1.p1 TRINITY_DN90318_c0_g1~~TRINITY_DN90318_c0_g1_i1.p1  ORF type:complete len:1414 (+),score=223.79 TRINITY_DN90318_c0_g1_i1:100-4341(+)